MPLKHVLLRLSLSYTNCTGRLVFHQVYYITVVLLVLGYVYKDLGSISLKGQRLEALFYWLNLDNYIGLK